MSHTRHASLRRDAHYGIVVEPNTLITSKTDLRGIITYCNQDFLAYSGYTEEELIGKPHNIIRHKDMPRCVFKMLWEYIQSGREIFAFVKNLAKSRECYWVFTNITPSFNDYGDIIGYYSVRRAPNLKAIPIIEDLYKQLINIESAHANHPNHAMEQSLKAVQEFIAQLNKPYNQIMCELQTAI